MPQLNHTIGDNKTFEIPLRWEGRNFTPGSEWNLIWTLYSDADDPEGSILRQKETGLGLVHSGNDALVTLVPQDTQGDAEEDPPIAAIAAGNYFWAVLAIKIADGTRRHVADGTYVLKAASTSLSTPSVPIYTSTPPSPNSVLEAFTSASAADSITDLDESLIKRGTGLLRATLTQIKDFVLTFLGNSATLDVGTTAGTVAAGDHEHDYLPRTGGSISGDIYSSLVFGIPSFTYGHLCRAGTVATTGSFEFWDMSSYPVINRAIVEGTFTDNRSISVQDKDGTIALTSDISDHASAADPHGDRAYTDNEISAATMGLVNDRGNFDASVNTWPTTGGSGAAGAILKGNLWTISGNATSGPLLGYAVGCLIRARVDNPGQTDANWVITAVGFGYTPENSANKTETFDINAPGNGQLYPTAYSLWDFFVNSTAYLGYLSNYLATAEQGELAESAVQPASITTDADDRALTLTDAWDYIRFTNATATVLTVPTNASVAFPIGTQIYFRRSASAGAITLSNAGVTVNGGANISSVPQSGNFALVKIDTDTWDFI